MFYYKTTSSLQTKKIAAGLAERFLKEPKKSRKSVLTIALVGDLGAGKTNFIQGFLKAAGIKKKITSPTFVLIKNYKLKTKNYKLAYHIDCYRIQKPSELLKLGFKEIVNPSAGRSQNIVLIEWADKIKNILPRDVIWVEFRHGDMDNQRLINVKCKNQKSK